MNNNKMGNENIGRDVTHLLMICLPVSLTFWTTHSFFASFFGGSLISPSRWLTAIILPIIMCHWAWKKNILSKTGFFVGICYGFVMTLSSYCFILSGSVFLWSSYKLCQNKNTHFLYQISTNDMKASWVNVITHGFVCCILSFIYLVDCGCGEQIIDLTHNYRCSWLAIAIIGALSFCNGDVFASIIPNKYKYRNTVINNNGQFILKRTTNAQKLYELFFSTFGGLLIGLSYYLVLLICISTNIILSAPPQWHVIIFGGLGGFLGYFIDSFLANNFIYTGIDSSGKLVHYPGENIKHEVGIDILDQNGVHLFSTFLTAIFLPYFALIII